MKRFSIMLATVCASFSFAQKVSDYKYISVPEKLSTFKNDDYGTLGALSKALKAKKYVVVSDSKDSDNANSCQVLHADLLDDSSFLKNKIILKFTDCNNKVVLEQKASSSIKDFVEGYKDALNRALVMVPISNPTTTMLTENPKVEEVAPSNEISNSVQVENKSIKYSNGKLNLQKIQIDDQQFILVDNNSSVPYATFRYTNKKDVFRVKLSSGQSTIGYLDKGNITIEVPQTNGEFVNEVFKAQ